MRSFLFRRCIGWLPLVVVLVFAGRCGTLGTDVAVRPTPVRPLWSEEILREHLRFFNGTEVAGRATGTAGYAVAAAYVAARMREFNLQPALESEYRLLYDLPLRHIRAARLVGVPSDSLALLSGVDFLPDARSDSGRVMIRSLVVDPDEAPRTVPGVQESTHAVLMTTHRAETAYLQSLRDAGARVVLAVGPLDPRPTAAPVGGLMVIRLAPHAAARLLRMPARAVAGLLLGATRERVSLPVPAQAEVQTTTISHAGAINVLGLLSGRHPTLRRDLVIVAADLDAVGPVAGLPTLDVAHFGEPAAALLEVARLYGYFGQFTWVPERSVLFVVFSGGRQGYAGLRAYLRQPLWMPDRTKAVLYVGLEPADEPAVRALLAPHGLPLYVVGTPPDSLLLPRTVLLTERRPPRQRTLRPAESPERPAPPRLPELIARGVQRVRSMADSLNSLLLRETVTPAPFAPALADTLDVPASN